MLQLFKNLGNRNTGSVYTDRYQSSSNEKPTNQKNPRQSK